MMNHTLKKFCVMEFRQSDQLRGKFSNNKDAQEGVCFGLVCEYWARIIRGEDTEKEDLDEIFGIAVAKQEIYHQVFRDTENDDSVFGAVAMNMMKTTTGLKFTFEDKGKFVDPFVQCIDGETDRFLLKMNFKEGAHAVLVGALGENGCYMFDPNHGLFLCTKNKDIQTLSSALWAEYKANGDPIKKWTLYSVATAKTARDRAKQPLKDMLKSRL